MSDGLDLDVYNPIVVLFPSTAKSTVTGRFLHNLGTSFPARPTTATQVLDRVQDANAGMQAAGTSQEVGSLVVYTHCVHSRLGRV